MEYRLKNSPFKVTAPNKEEGARMFQEMAPNFGKIMPSDLQEVKPENRTVRAYRIPKTEGTRAVVTELEVSAWDYSSEGVRFAIICSPNHNQFWVEIETGLIVGKNITTLPQKDKIKSVAKKRRAQMENARVVSNFDFWRIRF